MKVFLSTLFIIFIISTTTHADQKAALSIRASTLGLGGELALRANDKMNVRIGIYGLKLNRSETADNIDYDLKAKLISTGAMVDYYPWAKLFHLTAGIFYNGNKLEGNAVSGQDLAIGDAVYTPDEVGTLFGKVRANKFAPYAGIGWGNSTKGKSRFNFIFDVGVLFHGTPKANLVPDIPTDSPLNLDPALRAEFDADLAKEIASFQDDVANFKLYPVVSFGMGIKF